MQHGARSVAAFHRFARLGVAGRRATDDAIATPWRNHGGRIVVAGLAALIVACGSAPRGPAATTRATVARAEEHERARDHDLARAEYQRAIAEAPDRPSEIYARLELASQLAFWREVPAAITELEAVVALDPRQVRAWHDLGILRANQGDDAGARDALTRAIALAPEDPRPRIALAALLWQRGDLAAALAQYRALLDLDLPDKLRTKVEWAIAQLTL